MKESAIVIAIFYKVKKAKRIRSVKVHQHSSGAKKREVPAIGKSVAGNTAKIHMAVDSMGLPIEFEITGGEVHDVKVATELVSRLPKGGHTIADRGGLYTPSRE
ncbi:MAG: transposase [Oligoflexia bacterium]|nr:transposase [Oligoflexia bacterium]